MLSRVTDLRRTRGKRRSLWKDEGRRQVRVQGGKYLLIRTKDTRLVGWCHGCVTWTRTTPSSGVGPRVDTSDPGKSLSGRKSGASGVMNRTTSPGDCWRLVLLMDGKCSFHFRTF